MEFRGNSVFLLLLLTLFCGVNSLWTAWTTWGECSRTCGGGASISRRRCLTGSCDGIDVHYKTCQNEECPAPNTDYRAVQCSEHDGTEFRGELYSWIPETNNSLPPCALYCKARNHNIVLMVEPSVADGTRCYDQFYDMCIEGTCQTVGCDRKLGSGKKEDVCGVCGGNGSTCKLLTGLFRFKQEGSKSKHKELVVTIPRNSRHISVSELGSGHTGLILNDTTEFDLTNLSINLSSVRGVIRESGITVTHMSQSRDKEYFDMIGPAQQDIQVVAFYDDRIWKYIRYEFYRPLEAVWLHEEEGVQCSATCGGGLRYIWAVCVNSTTGERIDEESCLNEGLASPSPKVQRCNTMECPASFREERRNLFFEFVKRIRWLADPWTECSSSCDGGIQLRSISCAENTIDDQYHFFVDDSPCQAQGLALPERRRRCNEHPCPRWEAQRWSECSASCGPGWQYRVVACVAHNSQEGFGCNIDDRPNYRRPCLVKDICDREDGIAHSFTTPETHTLEMAAFRGHEIVSMSVEPSWMAESWGDCSVSCGVGISTREVRCRVIVALTGTIEDLSDENCGESKPVATQPCSMGSCVIDDVQYPEGVYDDVTSGDLNSEMADNQKLLLDDTSTSVSQNSKNQSRAPSYFKEDRAIYEWRYEEYSSCMPTCGNGTKMSSQRCFHIETFSLSSFDRCDVTKRRSSLILPCSNSPCFQLPLGGNKTYWELGPWNNCDVTCGRGTQSRSVICKRMPEGSNYTTSPLRQYQDQGDIMPDMMCPLPKPSERQECALTACPPAWMVRPWFKCKKTCGGLQYRTVACMQKLGTGETVKVSKQFCSRNKPSEKRFCNFKVNCPPKYAVRDWSQCHASCGKTFRTRHVVCTQVMAKRIKPVLVHLSRCSRLKKPAAKTSCHLKKCVSPRVEPVINASTEDFIQEKPQAKVRLQIGQTATILPRTIVIIKCRVQRFKKEDIRWQHDSRPIRAETGHVSVLPDGSLRILRARVLDSGRYTCMAGQVQAHSFVRVAGNTDLERELPTQPISKELDIGTSKYVVNAPERRSNNVNEVDIDFDEYPKNSRLVSAGNRPRVPRFRPRPILLPPNAEPPRRPIHPEISYVAAQPILEVNLRNRIEPDLTDADEIYDYNNELSLPISVSRKRKPAIIPEVLEFMATAQLDESMESANDLLQQFIETSDNFASGLLNEAERNVVFHSIIQKLQMLLDSSNDQITARSSVSVHTDNAALRNIVHLLEEQVQEPAVPAFEGASIPLQPTLSPLQLDRWVNIHVGGSLIVAEAERVTILCEPSGNPKPKISWFHDGIKLPEHERQYLLNDGSLRLLYPQPADSGTYTCVASNSYSNDSQSTELSVTQVPQILSTTTTLEDFDSNEIEVTVGSDIRAKLGAKIKINCPTKGYPDPYVVWRKDGPGLGPNTKVLTDNSLEIFPATAADQGLFGCEASNPAGSDYQASSLVLIDPPHISDELNVLPSIDGATGLPGLLLTGVTTESYRVKANSSVIMGCPVTGFPEPMITWFFNDQPITELGTTLDYQLMKLDKVLEIPNAGLDAEGVYTCHAQNDGGNITTRLDLGLIVYTYEFGAMTSCSASCGDAGIQYRRLSCMRDGTEEVDEWYCTGLRRPILTMQPCNRVDCPPRFVPGKWGSCSVSCGNGTRSRTPSCVIMMSDGSTREVASEICVRNETLNVETEPCQAAKCPEWRPGPWRRCTRKCISRGHGLKSRKVYCFSSNGTKLHPKHCSSSVKPKRRTVCPNSRCEPVWVKSRWSICSKSCGIDGFKTRIINCVYRGRKRQPAGNQCSKRGVPHTTIPCNRRKCNASSSALSGAISKAFPLQGRCVDRFDWCRRVREKKPNLCRKYKKVCCRSCS